MAEVTNELMFELMKPMHHDISEMRQDIGELKIEMNVIRGHLISIQTDVHNIYGILTRHDQRLDRIEKRLELREFAEAHSPYRPE